MDPKQNGQRKIGVTLLELVLTIVIVSIISIPFSMFITQQAQGMVQSSVQTAALNIARLEMESVYNLDYDSIAYSFTSNYKGYNYDVERFVTFIEGDPGSAESLKQITVVVRPLGESNDIATLQTLIARNVQYGA